MITILNSIFACAAVYASSIHPRVGIIGPVEYHNRFYTDAPAPLMISQRLGHLGVGDVARLTVDARHGDFLSYKTAGRLFRASALEINGVLRAERIRVIGIGLEPTRASIPRDQPVAKAVLGVERAYAEFIRELAWENPTRLFVIAATEPGAMRQNVYELFAEANLANVIVSATDEKPNGLPGVDTAATPQMVLNEALRLLSSTPHAAIEVVRAEVLDVFAGYSAGGCTRDFTESSPD